MYLEVKVLFPILTVTVLFRKAVSKSITGCKDNLCFEDSSYPYREIEEAFKKKPKEFSYAVGTPIGKKTDQEYESNSRKTCKLCEVFDSAEKQLMSIIDDNNQRMYIVMTNKKIPLIHYETCLNPGSKCSIESDLNDVTTNCIQKKTTINLLAFNATSKEFVTQPITYNSACDCVLMEEVFY